MIRLCLVSLLAALLMAHPLLLQAQTMGTVRVRMDNPDISVRYGQTTQQGAMDIGAVDGKARVQLGGGEYPLVTVEVPVVEGEITEVRGWLPRRVDLPPLIGVEAIDTLYVAEDFYDADSLREESISRKRVWTNPFMTIGIGILGFAGFTALALSTMYEYGSESNVETFFATVGMLGAIASLFLVASGVLRSIQKSQYVYDLPLPDNIAYNDSVRATAAQLAEQAILHRQYEENAVRIAQRNEAVAAAYIEYRVGDGPWVDVTPDLSEYCGYGPPVSP